MEKIVFKETAKNKSYPLYKNTIETDSMHILNTWNRYMFWKQIHRTASYWQHQIKKWLHVHKLWHFCWEHTQVFQLNSEERTISRVQQLCNSIHPYSRTHQAKHKQGMNMCVSVGVNTENVWEHITYQQQLSREETTTTATPALTEQHRAAFLCYTRSQRWAFHSTTSKNSQDQ